jgi:hypothetical protein
MQIQASGFLKDIFSQLTCRDLGFELVRDHLIEVHADRITSAVSG